MSDLTVSFHGNGADITYGEQSGFLALDEAPKAMHVIDGELHVETATKRYIVSQDESVRVEDK